MKILRTLQELNAIHFFKNHIFVFKGKNHLIDDWGIFMYLEAPQCQLHSSVCLPPVLSSLPWSPLISPPLSDHGHSSSSAPPWPLG